MRKHLQERHQDMTNDIVEFLEESTNTVAGYFTLQSDWLHENLCVIYKEVAETDTCDGTEETLLGVVGLSLWDKLLRIEEQGDSIQEAMDIQRSLPFGVTVGTEVDLLSAEVVEVKAAVEAVERKVETVEGKLVKRALDFSTANQQTCNKHLSS